MNSDELDVKKITVMLVDDHPMVQGGLRACLSFYEDIKIVGSTTEGKEALNKALELKPDVILMDISMPFMNGIDATEIITEQLDDTKVLIFSMHDSAEFVTSSIQAGASGYILKDTTSEEVYYAIKAVSNGKTHFSSSIAKVLVESPVRAGNEKLTTREQVILSYIAQGNSSKEIARKLNISFRTVEAHRRNIKAKLNIDSLAELVRYAVNHGLVES
ncbi:response regulator [Paraglaciecola psychrophila]|uniref:Two component LuxR family transcriptional regulator n=1 Tax=Paraglaciecola psychrophila 170 TaxID=1129794 RepID=K6Z5A1_9ALTE|nr:response regulator transcription factor [Paraglaciecola psychrophila]AGH46993.1 two component LuxR family transcriptional regulator [Paraglaciecola psychrophila 170]GAC40254.1 oxygen regulatory protein nreC [Paraglaciecola psychrophila 170]